MKHILRFGTGFLAASLLVAPMTVYAANNNTQPTVAEAEASAVAYMNSTQANSLVNWTKIADFAAGHMVASPTWPAKDLSASASTGTLVKVILSMLATHRDPHQVHHVNLVHVLASRQILSGKNAGYFADDNKGTVTGSVTNQALAIIALEDAGNTEWNPKLAETWLLAQQNKDGGFGYATGVASDSNDTAYVIAALSSLGLTAKSPAIAKALQYERSLQQSNGGFLYQSSSQSTDADSDGTVMDALASVGIRPTAWTVNGHSPLDNLMSLYDVKSGGFRYMSSGEYSGVNGYSTRDAIFGLAASVTGESVFQRLRAPHLTSLNHYWHSIEVKGGAWINHHWIPFMQLRDVAAAGTYLNELNPYWQSVAKHGGLWETVDGHPVWEAWNYQLAKQALSATFGADAVYISHLS
ncbi:prenyltransferase/squalene oxidase repeat-containing protein [Alicyclobacillus tolerans]|uniref:prenyltransferase/squalene oxidase repeat-containing protein n=1 Tax=Alicyclobacillus tolerans TaxID=90970 RepID=UPI003B7D90BE